MNPIQLIYADFTINESALELLKNETRPVVVISVVGPYRCGKSYLLNRLMGRRDGFPLGSTIEAKTKGIWFWIGNYFGNPEIALVLLDTEGLNDTQNADNSHDMRIFILSILLSSVFIYNTKGTIDSKALDGLHFATEMTRYISTNEGSTDESTGEDFAQYFPNFIWAIRDHHLQLQVEGVDISPDEYLEFCLKRKKGFTEQVYKYNALRDALKSFFPKRSCLVFPLPVLDQDKMNHLDDLPDSELSPSFKVAGDNFVKFIKVYAKNKTIKGSTVTGRSFGLLIQNYVDSVLQNNVCIDSTYSYVCKIENEKAMEDALKQLDERLTCLAQTFPLSLEKFQTSTTEYSLNATDKFLKLALDVKGNPDIVDKFNEKVSMTISEYYSRNISLSTSKCEQVLQQLFWDGVEAKSKNGEFSKPGGFSLLEVAILKVESDFLEMTQREEFGPKTLTVLENFRENKFQPLLNTIMQTDHLLTENEKKLKETEMARKRQEELAKFHQEEADRAKCQMEAQAIEHEKNIEKIETKLGEESEAMISDLKRHQENEMTMMRQNYDAGLRHLAEENKVQSDALQAKIVELQNRPPVVIYKKRPWWQIF